jgi:hypothetical protein
MNFTVYCRCTSKGMTTYEGGEGIFATLALVPDPYDPQNLKTGSLHVTYPITDDQFQIGLYYQMTISPAPSYPAA